MNIDSLNDRQREAVLYNDGPLLIIAGAGAGKTKTLTTKIAYLIEEEGVSPYNILAITFTNKAAKEMKDRVRNLIGPDANYIQISTFHSLGLKILKENYDFLGYEKNFIILDSDDTLRNTAVETIYKICKGLKIPMSELMSFSTNPEPTSEEAVQRIKTALGKVPADKAVKIAQIVEEMVDII